MKSVVAVAIWVLAGATLVRAQSPPAGQSSLAIAGKPLLTIERIERLTQYEHQNRKVVAQAGFEFVRVHFVAKWAAKADQDPCDALAGMRDPSTATRASEYELIDEGGRKVLGTTMDYTWVPPPQGAPPLDRCAFTILFQQSATALSFSKVRLKEAEADISTVAGAKGGA